MHRLAATPEGAARAAIIRAVANPARTVSEAYGLADYLQLAGLDATIAAGYWLLAIATYLHGTHMAACHFCEHFYELIDEAVDLALIDPDDTVEFELASASVASEICGIPMSLALVGDLDEPRKLIQAYFAVIQLRLQRVAALTGECPLKVMSRLH
jgi:hypothetical protein